MKNIIQRVCDWNAARYAQESSNELTASLLFEEASEYNDARSGDPVDQLDALCDITYVAIGAMWKLGLSASEIEQAIAIVCDANDSKTASKTPTGIKANIDKGAGFITPEPRLEALLNGRK